MNRLPICQLFTRIYYELVTKQGRRSYGFIIMKDSTVHQSHFTSDLAGVGIKGGSTFISHHLLQKTLSKWRISDELPECRESLDMLAKGGVKQIF